MSTCSREIIGMLVAEELAPLVDVSVLTGMVRQYGFLTRLQRGTNGAANSAAGDRMCDVGGCSKHLPYWVYAGAATVFLRRSANQGIRTGDGICSVHRIFSGSGR
ncbi:hypothetical protein EJ571_00625 [Mycobacteroides franklinii]|uniref:Uncharacterized protein n=2 Tax=Mycobacteroides franklinii TaxID=948102 RepID=A0A4R5PGM5_9MYCO|nr:hypothetical protein EJ571_00625 [Mycobacteroides franklinii]